MRGKLTYSYTIVVYIRFFYSFPECSMLLIMWYGQTHKLICPNGLIGMTIRTRYCISCNWFMEWGMASYWLRRRNAIRRYHMRLLCMIQLPLAKKATNCCNTAEPESRWEERNAAMVYISIFSSAKSLECVLVNLSVRRTIGKNWLRSAMAIGGTLEYNRAGVHSYKCLEMDYVKNN